MSDLSMNTGGGDSIPIAKKDEILKEQWDQFFLLNSSLMDAAYDAVDGEAMEGALEHVLSKVRDDPAGWGAAARMDQLLSYLGRADDPRAKAIPGKRKQFQHASKATFNMRRGLMKSQLQLHKQNLIEQRNPRSIICDREDTQGLNRKYLLDVSLAGHAATFRHAAVAAQRGYIEVGGEDWTIIGPAESCIIQNSSGEIEFVVVRKAAGHTGLIDLVARNVDEATSNFRSLRPTEPGIMTGNLLRPQRFSGDEILEMHHRLLAGSTLVWKLAESRFPAAVTADVSKELGKLPNFFTTHIPEGQGFTFKLGEMEYAFPEAPRCPPEVYHSQNYSSLAHSEQTTTRFAIAYHALRREESLEHSPALGGDFVDVGLKVLMRASSDTLFAFNAKHLHGTTPMQHIDQRGVVFPFSQRILDAYNKTRECETVLLDEVVEAPEGATVVSDNI
ncbi:hypothetical protein FRC01_001384 [Tulasnella sp. 417]|nr:hypothetical protein FRC01_001384 [Tulasnella sp. 417]